MHFQERNPPAAIDWDEAWRQVYPARPGLYRSPEDMMETHRELMMEIVKTIEAARQRREDPGSIHIHHNGIHVLWAHENISVFRVVSLLSGYRDECTMTKEK